MKDDHLQSLRRKYCHRTTNDLRRQMTKFTPIFRHSLGLTGVEWESEYQFENIKKSVFFNNNSLDKLKKKKYVNK